MGLLHSKNLTPHRAIWTLAMISAVVGCLTVVISSAMPAPSDAAIKALPHGFWSSFGYMTHDRMAALPNSFSTITLASNFGTFLLYMLSCIICIVVFHNHPNSTSSVTCSFRCSACWPTWPAWSSTWSAVHGFGTKMEPLMALGIAAVWAVYGGIYFLRASKAKGRTTLVESERRRPRL